MAKWWIWEQWIEVLMYSQILIIAVNYVIFGTLKKYSSYLLDCFYATVWILSWRIQQYFIFMCPSIASIIFYFNYNQQYATILIYLFLKCSTCFIGSSAHHQEHITVHPASGVVNQYCCWLVSWLRCSSILATILASSSTGWQHLKLSVQLCGPDDGRRNRLKHVEHFRNK